MKRLFLLLLLISTISTVSGDNSDIQTKTFTNTTQLYVNSTSYVDIYNGATNLSISSKTGTVLLYVVAEARTNFSNRALNAKITSDLGEVVNFNITSNTLYQTVPLIYPVYVSAGNHNYSLSFKVDSGSFAQIRKVSFSVILQPNSTNFSTIVVEGSALDNLNWTNITNYPSGCNDGQAVRVIGDIPTCEDNLQNTTVGTKESTWDTVTTKETVSNKSTDTNLGTSDTLYPSQKAVKTYADTKTTLDEVNASAQIGEAQVTNLVTDLNNIRTNDTNQANYLNNTFPGSSFITTLGTIVAGVWHGTSIEDAYIVGSTLWNSYQTTKWNKTDSILEVNLTLNYPTHNGSQQDTNLTNHTDLNGTSVHGLGNVSTQNFGNEFLGWDNLTGYPSSCTNGKTISAISDSSTCIEPFNSTYDTLNTSAERISNKSTDINLGASNTLYPSQNATKAYADTKEPLIVGSTSTKCLNGLKQWVSCSYNSAGAGVDFFYNNTASDLTGYETISRTPDIGVEQDESTVVNGSQSTFEMYATVSTGIGGTQIEGGKWVFESYAYVSATTGFTELIFNVSKATSNGGNQTFLFNVTTGNITDTSVALYTTNSVQPSYPINATDRLIVNVTANTSSSINVTVHFVHSGSVHASNIHTPLVSRHDELAGIDTGDIQHLTVAQKNRVPPSGGSSSNFLRGDNIWQALFTDNITEGVNLWFTNARTISAVQSILDAMNASSATNNTASQARDDAINITISTIQSNETGYDKVDGSRPWTGDHNAGAKNLTNIYDIIGQAGVYFLKNTTVFCSANCTITKYANGSILIDPTGTGGGITSESDPLWGANYSIFLTHVSNTTMDKNLSNYSGVLPNASVSSNTIINNPSTTQQITGGDFVVSESGGTAELGIKQLLNTRQTATLQFYENANKTFSLAVDTAGNKSNMAKFQDNIAGNNVWTVKDARFNLTNVPQETTTGSWLCLDANGQVQYYAGTCTVSDMRLKKNVEIITAPPIILDRFANIEIIKYQEINDPIGKWRYGVNSTKLAQDFPMLVTLDKNGTAISVSYELIAVLNTLIIQDQQKQLASLEARVQKLEDRGMLDIMFAKQINYLYNYFNLTKP